MRRSCKTWLLLATLIIGTVCEGQGQPCSPTPYRTIDGSCNNLQQGDWGKAGTLYTRGPEGQEVCDPPVMDLTTFTLYSKPATRPVMKDWSLPQYNLPCNRPEHARVISNTIGKRPSGTWAVNPTTPHSMFAVIFGQLVNHDLDENRPAPMPRPAAPNGQAIPVLFPKVELDGITPEELCMYPRAFNYIPTAPRVEICTNDTHPIMFAVTSRSARVPAATGPPGAMDVPNDATAWLDLDPIYGSDAQTAAKLRSNISGQLITEDYTVQAYLPFMGVDAQVAVAKEPNAVLYTFSETNSLPSAKKSGIKPGAQFVVAVPGMNTSLIFTSGDARASENIGLSLLHTVWHREHNRQAERVAATNPTWSDEQVFQRARAITIAKYQHIVYTQYIPSEFGTYFTAKLGHFHGYDPSVDPSTLMAFAAAAFRYGHSTLNNYPAIDVCGTMTTYGYPGSAPAPTIPPPQCQAKYPNISTIGLTGPSFQLNLPGVPGGGPFNKIGYTMPAVLAFGAAGGWSNVARGLIATRTAPISTQMDFDFRSGLGGGPDDALVVDIFAADIYRGRENQVPNYYTLRKAYSTGRHPDLYKSRDCQPGETQDPLECFMNILTSSPRPRWTAEQTDLAGKLQQLYSKVDRIDAIVGLLAEEKAPGSSSGFTLGNIVMEQYRRARDGDRFFYLNHDNLKSFTASERQEILSTTMGDVLNRNLDTPQAGQRGSQSSAYWPENPFLVPDDWHLRLSQGQDCSTAPTLYNSLDAASCY